MFKSLSARGNNLPYLLSPSIYHFTIFLFTTSCWKCSICLISVIPHLSVTWQPTAFCFPFLSLPRNSYWQGHKWLNQITWLISVLNLLSLFPLVSVDRSFLSLLPSFVSWPSYSLFLMSFFYNSATVWAQSFCFLSCLYFLEVHGCSFLFPWLLNESNFIIQPYINYN